MGMSGSSFLNVAVEEPEFVLRFSEPVRPTGSFMITLTGGHRISGPQAVRRALYCTARGSTVFTIYTQPSELAVASLAASNAEDVSIVGSSSDLICGLSTEGNVVSGLHFQVTNAQPDATYFWRDVIDGTLFSTTTEAVCSSLVSNFSTNASSSINAPGNGFVAYEYEVFGQLNGCNSVTTSFNVMIGGSPELRIEGNRGVVESSAQICVGGVAESLGDREYVSKPFGYGQTQKGCGTR